MRGNDFLDKMDLIDSAYIEEAEQLPKNKKSPWTRWGLAAACVCLIAAGAILAPTLWDKIFPPEIKVGINEDDPNREFETSGMGFESYIIYDISDLNNGNPWNEGMDITSLPVFENKAYDPSGAGIPKGLTEKEMTIKLNSLATSLDFEILSTEVIANGYIEKDGKKVADETPTEIHANTNKGMITVRADGSIMASYNDEGIEIPKEYAFAETNASDEKAKDVLDYLIESYESVLNFDNPVGVTAYDYNIYGDSYCNYFVYNSANNDIDKILNYNFYNIKFLPTRDGNLAGISIKDNLSVATKIGDYPIISPEEARNQLVAGKYKTSVPVDFPREDTIGKVELMYHNGKSEKMLIPYYRFYLELPNPKEYSIEKEGLKLYGAYYVPAISEENLRGIPLYEGGFN